MSATSNVQPELEHFVFVDDGQAPALQSLALQERAHVEMVPDEAVVLQRVLLGVERPAGGARLARLLEADSIGQILLDATTEVIRVGIIVVLGAQRRKHVFEALLVPPASFSKERDERRILDAQNIMVADLSSFSVLGDENQVVALQKLGEANQAGALAQFFQTAFRHPQPLQVPCEVASLKGLFAIVQLQFSIGVNSARTMYPQ
eukprot:CAMPEP_0177257122 /NCGR_PEP_ID=MMETSP0367-20130122/57348_1 /TAXON_ID=447022 ORGANISM="Scrippsiella hangoei-like, Strain SHHI-4" /NCGR_SAMPLE_ID=MMETSP0367 /ASSEMBLY_ACC=CAM_ASM_000362 /LENGTH=204 /DNA_ID=CAMNT_0018711135 /DNA_START=45 /DNA_END=656 /DNA_ORIENTATION=-